MELRGHMGATEFIGNLRRQTKWPITDAEMTHLFSYPPKPLLITPEQTTLIVSGPPGSGKSTLAKILASILGYSYLSTDEIRTENPTGSLSFDAEATRQVYHYLTRKAVVSVLDPEQPHGVVLDGTFPSTILDYTSAMLAQVNDGLAPAVINVLTSAETAWIRMNKRAHKWLASGEGNGYQPAVAGHFILSVKEWGDLATRMQSADVNVWRPFDYLDHYLNPDSVIEHHVLTRIVPQYFQFPE